MPRIVPRIRTCRAYQLAAEPLSAAIMQSSGACSENSLKIRIGLTGLAATCASASITSHQRATFFSRSSRQPRSSLRSQQRDQRPQRASRRRRRG